LKRVGASRSIGACDMNKPIYKYNTISAKRLLSCFLYWKQLL